MKKDNLGISALTLIFITLCSFAAIGQGPPITNINGTVCVGDNAQFRVTTSCAGYQWLASPGGVIQGSSTQPVVAVIWSSASSNAWVQVSYTSGGCSTSSLALTVTAKGGSAVVSISGPASFCSTIVPTFTATPTNGGTAPFYQWKVNRILKQSGSSTFYSPSPQLSNRDTVSVTLTSSSPCLTNPSANSNSITVTLIQPSPVSVVIDNPGPFCSTIGGTIKFTVTTVINGGSSPTYTWYRGVSGTFQVNDNQSIPTNGPVYWPHNALTAGERISCVVTSNAGCVSGNPATSNVDVIQVQQPTVPTISIDVANQTICSGNTATFSASSLQGTLSNYSWTLGTNGLPSSATTYSPPASYMTSPGQTINLTATVSGNCLSPNSASTSRFETVNAAPAVVGFSESASTFCTSGTVTLTLTSYVGSLNWQYRSKDGTGGSWSNWITYSTAPTTSTNYASLASGNGIDRYYEFHVVATVPNCSDATSSSQPVTVYTTTGTVTATIDNPGLFCSTDIGTITFTATPTNGGINPSYVWYRGQDGNTLAPANQLSGTNKYKPGLGYEFQVGEKISCKVTSSDCVLGNPATSNVFTIQIQQPITPTVSITPINVCEGDPVTFSVSSSSHTITSYNWKINSSVSFGSASTFQPSALVPPIALHSTDVVTLTAGMSGFCLASPPSGSASTSPVKPSPVAAIFPSGTARICSTCTQLITAGTGPGYSYQWQKNGSPITGAIASTYSTSQVGTYAVVVSLNGCPATSGTLALTINTRPVANAGSNQTVVLPTTSTTLPGSGTDANGDAITYLWTLSSGPTATLTNSTTSSLSLSDLVFGTYVFSLVVNDGIEASAPSYVTIYITYPPNNYSFVRESTIKVAGVTQEIAVAGLTFDQKSENITYYDGIGRPMQAVATQASPAWHDMVSPVVYDAFGREDRKYLPFVAAENTGFYKPAVIDPSTGVYQNAALNFYNGSYAIANDAAPYALSVFEPSPLNRITEQGAPGVAFQPGTNHTIKVSHQTNQTSEVLLFTHDQGTGLILLAPGRYYDPGALYANKTTDEHGNDVIQYIDKEGRTVCKKVQYKTDTDGVTKKYASTYYLFDDLGNLVVVLPPEGEKAIAPTEN